MPSCSSEFDGFSKGMKIAWGMQIEYTDNLNVRRDVVHDCYRLMLKLADLWFAFEHRREVAKTTLLLKPINAKITNSRIDFLEATIPEELKLSDITRHCNDHQDHAVS